MNVTAPMTMADAEARLVTIHGYGRGAARDLLRNIRDVRTHDASGFSIDYTLDGARYGRGHFIFIEDDPGLVDA